MRGRHEVPGWICVLGKLRDDVTPEEAARATGFSFRVGPRSGDRVWWIETQAPGAWPNGSPVEKAVTLKRDKHVNGDRAVVVGSFRDDENQLHYFVAWDTDPNDPKIPVLCPAWKLRLAGFPTGKARHGRS